MVVYTEDANSVVINGKWYNELNELSIPRLRQLIGLMDGEIFIYTNRRYHSKDYLDLLRDRKKRLQKHMEERYASLSKQ